MLIAGRGACRRSPLPPKGSRRKPRVVVDTNVLVAGISGFREPFISGRTASADLLHGWEEANSFIWLFTEDILDEYKEVLKRLHVRPNVIGQVINLIRERAEGIQAGGAVAISPDPDDDPFCFCAEKGRADFLVTLNRKDFPEEHLKAKVILPEAFVK